MRHTATIAQWLIDESRDLTKGVHSWRECYSYFGLQRGFRDEQAALLLAFYLASWGMFRGSAKIREYGAAAWIPVVQVLRSSDAKSIRGISIQDGIRRSPEIFDLLDAIEHAVRRSMPNVSLTPTLKTKVALGALACIPAYDRLVISAAKALRWPAGLSRTSTPELLRRAVNDARFREFRQHVHRARIESLPEMRLLDAFLNYRGRPE